MVDHPAQCVVLVDALGDRLLENGQLHVGRRTAPEVEHARDILRRGTSADGQLAVFEKATAEGVDEHEALCRVVDYLIEETMIGI